MNALIDINATAHYSSTTDLDAAVARVRDAARRFATLSLAARLDLATAMQDGYLAIAPASVDAACQAKGLDPASNQAAEEWATGPWAVVRQLRLIREQLGHLARTGNTQIGRVTESADGRASVRVFPANPIDSLLFQKCAIDVRMQAAIGRREIDERRAGFYRDPKHAGCVVLVLGAGNLASIGPMDVITKLFNEGKVCILKMNPVNAYLGPYFEQAFAAAIRAGYLAIVYGGAEVGQYLAQHVGIDEIHLTGSDATYDAIVWGPPGAARDLRRRNGTPCCTKPVSAELGNVSPVLLVPGPYTDRELAYQAEELACATTMNAAFLCNAARALITPRGWNGREVFLAHLQRILAGIPARRSYYPGAIDRWWQLTDSHSQAIRIGTARGDRLPWTLVTDLDVAAGNEPFFAREQFCPILAETAVASSDPIEYLEQAVAAANEGLWGNLSATLIVHPKLMRDTAIAAAVERAIARLRYGTVAVNAFSGMSFALAAPPWGAFPGSTAADIQSGNGWVHNTTMLDGIEKAVLRFPLTQFPKPAYFPSHRAAQPLLRALLKVERNAEWRYLPAVMLKAIQG